MCGSIKLDFTIIFSLPLLCLKFINNLTLSCLTCLIIASMYLWVSTIIIHFPFQNFRYMCSKLLEVAKKSSCVVAVVGKGHLQGIKKHWEQPVSVGDHFLISIVCMHFMHEIISFCFLGHSRTQLTYTTTGDSALGLNT